MSNLKRFNDWLNRGNFFEVAIKAGWLTGSIVSIAEGVHKYISGGNWQPHIIFGAVLFVFGLVLAIDTWAENKENKEKQKRKNKIQDLENRVSELEDKV